MVDDEFEDEEEEPSEPDDIEALAVSDVFVSDREVAVDASAVDEDDVLVEDSDDVGTLDEEAEDEEDEVVDLEEELHPDDVEEPLDVLLLERTSSGLLDEDEYDEDEDDSEADDRSDPSSRIPPKRPGEFVCRSCFLVKHPSQLADAERMLCSDCV
ncbi:MAG: DUF4193 family protein [Actinomycetota bacterium]